MRRFVSSPLGLLQMAPWPAASSEMGDRDPSPFAIECEAGFAAQRAPSVEQAGMHDWAAGIDCLLNNGRLDVAEHTLRHMRARFPEAQFASRLSAIFDRLPSDR